MQLCRKDKIKKVSACKNKLRKTLKKIKSASEQERHTVVQYSLYCYNAGPYNVGQNANAWTNTLLAD